MSLFHFNDHHGSFIDTRKIIHGHIKKVPLTEEYTLYVFYEGGRLDIVYNSLEDLKKNIERLFNVLKKELSV